GRGRRRRHGEHLRLRRGGEEGLDRHAAGGGRPRRGGQGPRRRRGGVPGGAVRRRTGERTARGHRAGFRRLRVDLGAAPGGPAGLLAEAAWLADAGVRELVLVSENSTSYGKDLGELRLLEMLLPRFAEVPGIDRVRVNYLQPAEMRPSLIDAITGTAGVVPYFDLSFQHSSAEVLRRMKRFGDTDR